MYHQVLGCNLELQVRNMALDISNFSKVLTEQSYKFQRVFNSKEIVGLKHVNNICPCFSHEYQSACLVEYSNTVSQGDANATQPLFWNFSHTTWYLATVMIYLNYGRVSCAEPMFWNIEHHVVAGTHSAWLVLSEKCLDYHSYTWFLWVLCNSIAKNWSLRSQNV